MLQKIKQLINTSEIKTLLNRFQDIRFTGQVIFVLVIILISWSGVKAIQLNYDLQQQILKLNEQIKIQKLINQNIAYQNQYYSSKQYLELSARQNFGLGNAGETEVIIPKNVALSYTVAMPGASSSNTKSTNLPSWDKNLQNWFDFFLHKPLKT